MRTSPTSYAEATEPIRPDELYPLHAFHRVTGLSRERVRQARARGISPATLKVGRRVYVKGSEAIRFIEQIAEPAIG